MGLRGMIGMIMGGGEIVEAVKWGWEGGAEIFMGMMFFFVDGIHLCVHR